MVPIISSPLRSDNLYVTGLDSITSVTLNTSLVKFVSYPFSKCFLYLYIRTKSPTLYLGFFDNSVDNVLRFFITRVSFSFLDANVGVICIVLCIVLLYTAIMSGNIFTQCLLPLTVNLNHIFSLIVLLNLSIITALPSLYV